MADVFISYAREDREFARRLVQALRERGRESWIDLEDIEPSDIWWRAITEAIDSTDAVVFIASPDSIASEFCRRELEHATARRKRLIAVVCDDVEGLPVPEEIAAVNWIFLRDQDDWSAGIAQLERALDVEIDFVRLHTRVLTRAEAWRLSGRRPTPLLRGEELRLAEGWVARAAAGAEPQPTELEAEFIAASRRMASRRQRQALGASLLIASVAIALSIFAFIQRAQARHQARLAQSRQLAAAAEADLASDPEQSIALAAQGLRVEPTPQAIHALWSALGASRLRADLRGPSPVSALAFAPAGDEVAVGSEDGAVRVWRLSDRRIMWTGDQGGPPVSSISFSRAGDLLAVAHSSLSAAAAQGCSVELRSAATGATLRTLGMRRATTCLRSAAFVGDSRTVAVLSGDGALGFWNADRGDSISATSQVIQPLNRPAAALTVSRDGADLAVVALHDVRILSLRTGREIANIQTSASGLFNPVAATFSPDGQQLLISGEYGTETYYLGARTTSDLYAQAGSTNGAAWSDDGRVLGAGAGFLGVDVWSSAGRLIELLHGSSTMPFEAVAFSATGLLAGGSRDGSVRIWQPDPDRADRLVNFTAGATLDHVGTTADGSLAAAGDAGSEIVVTDSSGRQLAVLRPAGDGPFALAGRDTLAFTRHGSLVVWRVPSGQPVRSSPLGSTAAPAALAVSADGSVAATLQSDGTLRTLTASGSHSTVVSLPSATPPQLSITPDGRLLVVASASGIRILDAATLRSVRSEPGVAASISGDGSLIAVQRQNLSIVILRTGSWQTQTTVSAVPTLTPELAFSADDRLLASMGNDGSLRTWDTRDGTLVATRQVIESSLVAQRTITPPVALTRTGFAIVGDDVDNTVNAYHVCDRCFSPRSLLVQADTRLAQIAAVSAR